jgi:hypothetical protein
VTAEDRPRLKEVDHTHPHAAETVTEMYRRGPSVADGDGSGDEATDDVTVADVNHVAPDGLSPTDAFERGGEATDAADDERDGGDG